MRSPCSSLEPARLGRSPSPPSPAVIFSGRLGALRRTLKDSAELVFVDPVRPSLCRSHRRAQLTAFPRRLTSLTSRQTPETSLIPTRRQHLPRQQTHRGLGGLPSRMTDSIDSSSGSRRRSSFVYLVLPFSRFDCNLRMHLQHLRDILEKQGPFDGVFGFSRSFPSSLLPRACCTDPFVAEGAAAAAVLTALVENPSLDPIFAAPSTNPDVQWPPKPFSFAILSAGFFPLDPKVSKYFNVKPKTPTLHVLGRGDTIVGEDRAVPLTQAFVDSRVEWHEGGSSSSFCPLPFRPAYLPISQATTPRRRLRGVVSSSRTSRRSERTAAESRRSRRFLRRQQVRPPRWEGSYRRAE